MNEPKIQTEKKQNNYFSPFIATQLYKSSSFGILSILLVLCIILSVTTKQFLTFDNLFSVFRAFSFIALMAIGECLVIITGGIDLSVGSIFALAGVITAYAMAKWGLGLVIGIMLGILAGAALGIFNGILITKVNLPPFIATLGTLSVARGLAYGITGGYTIANFPHFFNYLGQGYIGLVPVPVIVLLIFAVIFTVFLSRTIVGRRIYALGGNVEAARISGIKVENIKILVYMLSGIMSALAGILTVARLGVAMSTAGLGYELDAIAAVIIGGTSVSGGKGTIFGAIIGAAIMGILRNGLVLLSVSAYWQQTVIGSIIILAVAIDQLRYRKSKT